MKNTDIIMEEVKAVRKDNTLEKHVQTILLTVVTAGIIGGYTKINDISESLIRIEEREKVKTEQINSIQAATNRMQLDIDKIKERLTIIESQSK